MSKKNQEFTNQERLENIDKMIFQYLNHIKETTEKITELLDKRKLIIEELNIDNEIK